LLEFDALEADMVRQDNLSSVLSEFARTMLTDFKVQGILDHLVERIVDVLGVTGAGVTLISPGLSPRYVAASSEMAMHLERLQTTTGQGPCLTAYSTGEAVVVPDLADEFGYPEFIPAAREVGLAAVFAFPLRHGGERLGALDIYRDVPGPLAPDDMAAAQTLADVAAAYLINAEARAEVIAASDRFRERSLHDSLTGLPNRVLLQERIEHAALRAARSRAQAAILFVDLDRFKRVNDLYGHAVGDELLAAVAARLSSMVRPSDTLARVSGDEFVILCEDVADVVDVDLLATRIVEGFTAPFIIQDQPIRASASVGVAYSRPGETIAADLMDGADTAMYQAKRRGGGTYRFLDPQDAAERTARDDLVVALREAVGRQDLGVAYQPIVRAADGLVVGVEALLRWTHPLRGIIPASAAVEVAERNALITDLGSWVLNRSCQDRVRWLTGHPDHPDRPLDLSVNVSPHQVLHPGFTDMVRSALEATGMDPSALILEMTEGIFLDDDDRALRVLADLKTLGVRLALDDFGSGFSSMSYLRRFPIDLVKIDQRFVSDITHDPASAAIVAAIANLAHLLNMRVVAEGVETTEQRDEVVRLGCDLAQGFLFAKPRSGVDIDVDLRTYPLHLPQTERARAS